jgi:hypothetical protein
MQTNKTSTTFLKDLGPNLMREEVKNLLRNSEWHLETYENKKKNNSEQYIEDGDAKQYVEDRDDDYFKNNGKLGEEEQKDYELQLILNKISLNSESEKLKSMQSPQAQQANNIINGKIIRIQAGILSAAEIKRLKMLEYHIEEFKSMGSLDIGTEGMGIENVPQIPRSIRITMFPNSKNPPLVEILSPVEELPTNHPMDTTNPPKPIEIAEQPPKEQPINQPEPPEPINQPEPINPVKPIETPASIEQTQLQQPELGEKPEKQQILSGWTDSYNLETNPNMMTTSCIIHYYTEEQRSQLERAAHGQLQNMLDSNKHLGQYYTQKDNPSRESGWSLGTPHSY